MKRRNWAMLVICAMGLGIFLLSRTVWGPPAKAIAAEPARSAVQEELTSDEPSDAAKRYLFNQPRHWRYVMLKH